MSWGRKMLQDGCILSWDLENALPSNKMCFCSLSSNDKRYLLAEPPKCGRKMIFGVEIARRQDHWSIAWDLCTNSTYRHSLHYFSCCRDHCMKYLWIEYHLASYIGLVQLKAGSLYSNRIFLDGSCGSNAFIMKSCNSLNHVPKMKRIFEI